MAKKSKKQENQGNAAGIDKASLKAMKATEKRLTEIYESAVRQCVNLGLLTQYDPAAAGKLLQFKDYPAVDKMLHTELTKMRDDIVSNIREGERAQWQCANAKADALVTSLAAMCGVEPSAFKGCFKHNLTALAGFQTRKIGGISLSGNVWNITKGFQKEMELALSVGIANGRSAADVAEAVRRLLNNPTEVPKLITDKFGAEVMNKAWRDLHPGRGVYRSAFKNALRLTATENNIAYMTAEHERWQQLPFVLGIKVNLSKNHNCVGVPTGKFTDICDKLQGTYPKTFKFTGWHPFCRCFATTINSSVEDMKRWIDDNEDMEDFKPNPKDVVTALPKGFTEWMKGNAERVAKAAKAGTLPYFLKDNKWAMERKKTALDIAKERHEARTPEQVKEIKDRWNERTMTLKEGNDALSIFDGMEGADVSALKHAMAHADFDAIKVEVAKLREFKKKLESKSRKASPAKTSKKNDYVISDVVQTEHPPTFIELEEIERNYSISELTELQVKRNKRIMSILNCDRDTADAYREALNAYSFKWDGAIRQCQRGDIIQLKKGQTVEKVKKYADAIEEFIRQAPQFKGRAYRGMTLSDKALKNLIKKLEKGKMDNMGSASWSTSLDAASDYALKDMFKMDVAAKQQKINAVVLVCDNHYAATSIQAYSHYPTEFEVLASKRCKYKLVSMSEDEETGIITIRVENTVASPK